MRRVPTTLRRAAVVCAVAAGALGMPGAAAQAAPAAAAPAEIGIPGLDFPGLTAAPAVVVIPNTPPKHVGPK